MNPLKCAFSVMLEKFLGLVVRHRSIEIDQAKVREIQNMPTPTNLKELRGLQGHLAYIRRFIPNLLSHCRPLSHLMNKGAPFERDDSCQKAFNSIKRYLFSPPIVGAPIPGKPHLLYIIAQEHSLGALCAQENSEGMEKAFYYLSRTLVGAELNYSSIEKMSLALMFVVQKLKHYMQAHTQRVISKVDLVKYILSRLVLQGRLARWAVILEQYDLIYISSKAVKGQALVDFLCLTTWSQMKTF